MSMSICNYVYMYICIYVYLCIYIHTCLYVYMSICLEVYICCLIDGNQQHHLYASGQSSGQHPIHYPIYILSLLIVHCTSGHYNTL